MTYAGQSGKYPPTIIGASVRRGFSEVPSMFAVHRISPPTISPTPSPTAGLSARSSVAVAITTSSSRAVISDLEQEHAQLGHPLSGQRRAHRDRVGAGRMPEDRQDVTSEARIMPTNWATR